MANRIAATIAAYKGLCDKKRAESGGQEALDKLNTDMDFEEHFRFQELKSHAYMHGLITLDEANLLYRELGGAVSVFNSKAVHVKVALTNFFHELLELKIKGAFNGTAKNAEPSF